MKVLIVGAAGFVGSRTSLYFRDLGHDVTIMSRTAPRPATGLELLPFVRGNYIEDDCDDGRL